MRPQHIAIASVAKKQYPTDIPVPLRAFSQACIIVLIADRKIILKIFDRMKNVELINCKDNHIHYIWSTY